LCLLERVTRHTLREFKEYNTDAEQDEPENEQQQPQRDTQNCKKILLHTFVKNFV
jgi:hypothetical protein